VSSKRPHTPSNRLRHTLPRSESVDRKEHLLVIQGFGQVVVAAHFKAFLPVGAHGIRGERIPRPSVPQDWRRRVVLKDPRLPAR